MAAAGSYQVTKQDPEELNHVCKVMQDLIRMHDSVFTVSQEGKHERWEEWYYISFTPN